MNRSHTLSAGLGLLLLVASGSTLAVEGEALLEARCGNCHQTLDDGTMERIDAVRKTPEGWDMTIARMLLLHGLVLEAGERHALVKHLADTRGLAPAETRDWRYVLERQPNHVEQLPDDQLATMCARCHTHARLALQRRDREDWLKLVHFHVGQYPTIEYQALARDRNWWEIATTEMPDALAELYPLDTEDWRDWQAADKPDPSGAWRVSGHRPGQGGYAGTAVITGTGTADRYHIRLNLSYTDGSRTDGEGEAVLYTGHEWRASLSLGEESVQQVLALSEDGSTLEGRWFLADNDALGGDIRLTRLDHAPAIVAVQPPYLRTGQRASVVLHGTALDGAVNLGDGVTVHQVLYRSPAAIALDISAAEDAPVGARDVQVGETVAAAGFTVYDRIDTLRVEPDPAIARVGGNGGPLAPVPAQFDAVAYLDGPDGEPGTDDDIRIGRMPARWTVTNASPAAEAMQDTEYAGRIDDGGLFMPAGAGPNPERRYQTNNAGELDVVATVGEGEQAVSGSARLIVTVQRWNDPPIR